MQFLLYDIPVSDMLATVVVQRCLRPLLTYCTADMCLLAPLQVKPLQLQCSGGVESMCSIAHNMHAGALTIAGRHCCQIHVVAMFCRMQSLHLTRLQKSMQSQTSLGATTQLVLRLPWASAQMRNHRRCCCIVAGASMQDASFAPCKTKPRVACC